MLKNAYTLYIIQSLASQSSPSMNNYENINLYPIFFLTVKTSLFVFIYLYTLQCSRVRCVFTLLVIKYLIPPPSTTITTTTTTWIQSGQALTENKFKILQENLLQYCAFNWESLVVLSILRSFSGSYYWVFYIIFCYSVKRGGMGCGQQEL